MGTRPWSVIRVSTSVAGTLSTVVITFIIIIIIIIIIVIIVSLLKF